MSALITALDALVAELDTVTAVPVTRDPARVRAHLASAGVCVFVRPPDIVGRTGCGWQLDVPISLVLPATDSQPDNDRAYPLLEQLLEAVGHNQSTREPVTLGPDRFPAHTFTARIGA